MDWITFATTKANSEKQSGEKQSYDPSWFMIYEAICWSARRSICGPWSWGSQCRNRDPRSDSIRVSLWAVCAAICVAMLRTRFDPRSRSTLQSVGLHVTIRRFNFIDILNLQKASLQLQGWHGATATRRSASRFVPFGRMPPSISNSVCVAPSRSVSWSIGIPVCIAVRQNPRILL